MFAGDWQLEILTKSPVTPTPISIPHLCFISEFHFKIFKFLLLFLPCSPKPWYSLTPLMFRSLMRLLTSLIGAPAASVSTLLYYSELLPQNIILERLVRHELLDRENYLFHFLINFLRCFW
ncbi:hypothetical protein GBA52_022617 [Prunus armeniaca]|nr:hypothetical protein GBA52_022617 [Prunus armeniaca]